MTQALNKIFDGHLLGDPVAMDPSPRYVVEASAIGLKPGEWPMYLQPRPTVGNAQAFERVAAVGEPDGLKAVIYRQLNGCVRITVYND